MRGRVKARIEWSGFEGTSVILPICPRSPGVKRRNLAASLISLREKTDQIHLILCDTLDRHNLSGADTQDQARRNGDLWLSTGVPEIRNIFPSFNPVRDILRWDDVRADPEFSRKLSVLSTMHESSEAVRMVIERIAGLYLKKRDAYLKKYGLPFDRDREMQRSSSYLIEEFAGTSVYADWFPGVPEAYWGVYVGDHEIFNRLNTINPSIDLTLPRTLAIYLEALDPPVAGESPPSSAAA